MSAITPVAGRYARALFDLAKEERAVETFQRQLREIADAVNGSPELLALLANPTVAPQAKHDLMAAIAGRVGLGPLLTNAVLLVTDHGRGTLLPRIAERFDALADKDQGRIRAEVVSASPLSAPQQQRLAVSLEELTGKKVALKASVDPTLIGGVVARIGDKVYDGSLRTRLTALRAELVSER